MAALCAFFSAFMASLSFLPTRQTKTQTSVSFRPKPMGCFADVWGKLAFGWFLPISEGPHLFLMHFHHTCLSFSRSAWYERITTGSALLHPPRPPPPLALLFQRWAPSRLPFSPDTQLASFLMGALSDLLTLATEFMLPRRSITLVLKRRTGEQRWAPSFAHDGIVWQDKVGTHTRCHMWWLQ